MVERHPTRPTPVPDQQQTPQEVDKGSRGVPAPKPEDANSQPETIDTPPTGRRYLVSREESLERMRWYMGHRRDYTENPPTEEEIKRAQEQIERARRLREIIKNPPVEGSGQDNIGKDIK